MSGQVKLSDWKIFEVLAEKGSFRKASEVLDLDSANIKRSLDKLESALNLRFFTRSPRGLRLTDEGIAYQFKIKELMAPLEVELAEPKPKVVSVQYDARISFSRLLLLLSRYRQIDSGLIFDCSGNGKNTEDYLSVQLQPGKGLQGFRRSAVISPRLLSGKAKPITFRQLSEFPYVALSRDLDSEPLNRLKPTLIVNGADEAIRSAVLGLGFCFVFSENTVLQLVTAGSLLLLPIELPEDGWNLEINSSSNELAHFFTHHRNLLLTK